ncbi:MAG TPA: DNA methyltransferase [Candidatus Lokiarchaeia archaeon]
MIEINKIHQGDCLELMKQVEDKSIDLVLCDLPYGTTDCQWDEIIPLDRMWEQYKRIIRNNGFIILCSSQPFTTKLINSNIEDFSHQWIWEKEQGTNPLLANLMPMKNFEDIIVFYNDYKKYDYEGNNPLRIYFKKVLDYIGLNLKKINEKLGHRKAEHTFYVTPKKAIMEEIGQRADHTFRNGSTQFSLCTKETYKELIKVFEIDKMEGFENYESLLLIDNTFKNTLPQYPRVYNPQMVRTEKGVKSCGGNHTETLGMDMIGNKEVRFEKFPTSILRFNRDKSGFHPTQKPVALFEYLIKTYTNEGNLVLDNCIGSGTTAIACINTNRKFIGMELSEDYVKIAEERLKPFLIQTKLSEEVKQEAMQSEARHSSQA